MMEHIVASHKHHEHLGPVVPVDPPVHRPERPRSSSVTQLQVPMGRGDSSGPVSPDLGGSEHKLIIGASDEHHILTTAGGQRKAQATLAAMKHKQNFNTIMTEYMGACFEDNCNIGKNLTSSVVSLRKL